MNPKRESWGTVALICGVAPVPLTIMTLVPFVGCLAPPLTLLAIPAAIGFGIAGILQAGRTPAEARTPEQKLNGVFAWCGLSLGILWVVLAALGVALFFRHGGFEHLLDPPGLKH